MVKATVVCTSALHSCFVYDLFWKTDRERERVNWLKRQGQADVREYKRKVCRTQNWFIRFIIKRQLLTSSTEIAVAHYIA